MHKSKQHHKIWNLLKWRFLDFYVELHGAQTTFIHAEEQRLKHNQNNGSRSLIIAYVFRIYTHIWTSHENFPPNSQHVRTHMSLFLNSFFC